MQTTTQNEIATEMLQDLIDSKTAEIEAIHAEIVALQAQLKATQENTQNMRKSLVQLADNIASDPLVYVSNIESEIREIAGEQ